MYRASKTLLLIRQPEKKKKRIKQKIKKRQAVAQAKALADKIRKRKFPMDDVSLRTEDKLLGIRSPDGTDKLSLLPHALECCIPFEQQRKQILFRWLRLVQLP